MTDGQRPTSPAANAPTRVGGRSRCPIAWLALCMAVTVAMAVAAPVDEAGALEPHVGGS